MLDILAIAPRVLGVPPEHAHAETRQRSRGGLRKYGKQSASVRHGGNPQADATSPLGDVLIREGGFSFTVNFNDYLDTGIFLNHRITRGLVREHARQARTFLNLFAYTGTATCYAADAGVEETVTVDLSNTYLDWAERNMKLNGFTGPAIISCEMTCSRGLSSRFADATAGTSSSATRPPSRTPHAWASARGTCSATTLSC